MKTLTLDDLKPKIVIVKIMTAYGREIKIPFVPLTYEEWGDLGRAVVDPLPPKQAGIDPNDPDKVLPNPNDKHYQEQLKRNGDDRAARRLFTALDKAREYIEADAQFQLENPDVLPLEVEGDTPLDKWYNATEQGDNLIIARLQNAVYEACAGGRVLVEQRASSFRGERLPSGDDASVPAQRVDVEPVA